MSGVNSLPFIPKSQDGMLLILRVIQHFRHVLEVRVVAKRTEVLSAVVVVILDDLRFLLGDVARFGSGLLLQPLLRGE